MTEHDEPSTMELLERARVRQLANTRSTALHALQILARHEIDLTSDDVSRSVRLAVDVGCSIDDVCEALVCSESALREASRSWQ